MDFFLGTHQTDWLGKVDVPLFVSDRRLKLRRTFRRAGADWALDSGGFSELSLHGEWTVPAISYALRVERYQKEIGRLRWAAIQDWMCEPFITARTGLAVCQHQARTVANYRDLLCLSPGVPWMPVIQGYSRDDYLRCIDLYDAAGFDLTRLPVVGLGSVCRRQDTSEAEGIVRELSGMGLRLHAFGFKIKGLRRIAHLLESSDSMAWSLDARRDPPLDGCAHKSCANCRRYALRWREKVLRAVAAPKQGVLF